jgi:hypothetical protein
MHMSEYLTRMQLDGWCVVENVIPADEVAAVRSGILAATAQHRNLQAPKNIGHVSGVINYDQSVAPYLAEPHLLGLIEALLGPHVRVSFTTATTNGTGQRARRLAR